MGDDNDGEDMYVIIVDDQVKQEPNNEPFVKHDEIDIKEEPQHEDISDVEPTDEQLESEYLETDEQYLSRLKSNLLAEFGIREITKLPNDEYQPSGDEEYISNETDKHYTMNQATVRKRRSKKKKVHSNINKVTIVKELRNNYPNYTKDQLIQELVKLMRTVRPPPMPENYCNYIDARRYLCTACGKESISEVACAQHFQQYHGVRHYQCYGCDKSYRSKWTLYRHEKRDCKSQRDMELVLKARGIFLGRKGRNRPYLQRHLPFLAKINTGKMTDVKMTDFKMSDNRFECQLCSATFRSKMCLESHERSHRGERPFHCQKCERAYTSQSGLKRHLLTHEEPRFQCDTCKRKFKQKDTLVTHMNTHGEPRFKCTEVAECTRRFSTRAALNLHVRATHLNLPPPCACRLCPRRFRGMSELSSHMKREHGVTILTRTMFFKKLPTLSDLEVKNAAVVLNSEKYIEEIN